MLFIFLLSFFKLFSLYFSLGKFMMPTFVQKSFKTAIVLKFKEIDISSIAPIKSCFTQTSRREF
jgi:hypothetical protein